MKIHKSQMKNGINSKVKNSTKWGQPVKGENCVAKTENSSNNLIVKSKVQEGGVFNYLINQGFLSR